MKTKSTIYGLLILTALLAGSCTIQKRLFQPGYSVEWKKKMREKSESETTDLSVKTQESDSTRINSFANTSESPVENDLTSGNVSTVETKDPETTDQQEPQDTFALHTTENQEIAATIAPKKSLGIPDPEPAKELEIFGIMSFGLYFCSLALGIFSLFALNALPVIVIACLMILLSFTLGLVSVIRYRKDKSRYYRNFFGYFGMIASIATMGFAAFLLLFAWGLDSF